MPIKGTFHLVRVYSSKSSNERATQLECLRRRRRLPMVDGRRRLMVVNGSQSPGGVTMFTRGNHEGEEVAMAVARNGERKRL